MKVVPVLGQVVLVRTVPTGRPQIQPLHVLNGPLDIVSNHEYNVESYCSRGVHNANQSAPLDSDFLFKSETVSRVVD